MTYEERSKWGTQVEHDATFARLIHIPLASFDRDRHEPWAFLSPSELKQANRYRTATRRLAYVAGRAASRLLLSQHWSCSPETFRFYQDRYSKPYVQSNDGKSFAGFNLSHSPSELVVGITSGEAIGIDVESFHQRLHIELLVRNYFSAPQQEEWLKHPLEERERAFLRGWTRKEAAWKLFGNEDIVAWNDIEVTLENTPNACVRAKKATGEPLLLDCFTWQPSVDSLASAAILRHPTKERIFDIQAIDFDRLSELVWTSDAADYSGAHAARCHECSSGRR